MQTGCVTNPLSLKFETDKITLVPHDYERNVNRVLRV